MIISEQLDLSRRVSTWKTCSKTCNGRKSGRSFTWQIQSFLGDSYPGDDRAGTARCLSTSRSLHTIEQHFISVKKKDTYRKCIGHQSTNAWNYFFLRDLLCATQPMHIDRERWSHTHELGHYSNMTSCSCRLANSAMCQDRFLLQLYLKQGCILECFHVEKKEICR
jgi:hypothetical protein